jgi:4-amino-4-deoxy-L-arabinose transferase-like glycosyltransferase
VEKVIKFTTKHKFIIALVLIGGFLRLYNLQASLQFLGDQGRDVLVLYKMLTEFDLPFIGPITSVGGFFLGPLYYYLMAPFLLLFNFNPVGPAVATAMIGVLTIPAIYYVTLQMLSKKAAKFTSLLFAIGAMPVILTRGAWNPNPMPLAVLGLVFGFYKARTTHKTKWLILSAISLGIALQLHYMIVFLGPFIALQLIKVFKDKQLRPKLIHWFLTIIILMTPLILFELKNNFINFSGLIEYLTKNDYQKFNFLQTFKDLKGRSEQAIGMLLGYGEQYSLFRVWLTRLIWLPGLILLVKKSSLGYKMIISWLTLSIIAISFYRGVIPAYYIAFIMPSVFMLLGFLLSLFSGKLKLIPFIFIAIFIYFNSQTLYKALTETGNLNSVKKTAQFILKDVQENNHQDYNLTLIDGTKDYKAYSFRYFLKALGGQPLGIDQYPNTQVLYLVSPYPQTEILSKETWEIKSLRPAEVTQIWEFESSENVYKIERL